MAVKPPGSASDIYIDSKEGKPSANIDSFQRQPFVYNNLLILTRSPAILMDRFATTCLVGEYKIIPNLVFSSYCDVYKTGVLTLTRHHQYIQGLPKYIGAENPRLREDLHVGKYPGHIVIFLRLIMI